MCLRVHLPDVGVLDLVLWFILRGKHTRITSIHNSVEEERLRGRREKRVDAYGHNNSEATAKSDSRRQQTNKDKHMWIKAESLRRYITVKYCSSTSIHHNKVSCSRCCEMCSALKPAEDGADLQSVKWRSVSPPETTQQLTLCSRLSQLFQVNKA